jgi:hypothetical protein
LLGDLQEDLAVARVVEVRSAAAEIEVPEPRQPPGLVQVEIEDDLQRWVPPTLVSSA